MERNWLEEAQKRWQKSQNRRGHFLATGAGDFPPFSVVWGALDLSPHVYRITIDNDAISIILFDISVYFRESIWINLKQHHSKRTYEALYIIDKPLRVIFDGITQQTAPQDAPFVLTLEGKLARIRNIRAWGNW